MENLTNDSAVEQAPATVSFITMAAFKAIVGTSTISLRRNPKTGKLFASDDLNTVYFVTNATPEHGELNPKLPVMWRVEGNDYSNACLVNGTEDVATF